MADIGTLITNTENQLRDIRAMAKKIEEVSADILDQYNQLGASTATDAWFAANPDAKEYSAAEFSTAVGNLSQLSDIIPTAYDNTFILITGYTPRKA